VNSGPAVDSKLVKLIEDCLRKPVYFRDIIDATKEHRYRAVLLAWSEVRMRHQLERDELGRFWCSAL
jgi:hypothetical protein